MVSDSSGSVGHDNGFVGGGSSIGSEIDGFFLAGATLTQEKVVGGEDPLVTITPPPKSKFLEDLQG